MYQQIEQPPASKECRILRLAQVEQKTGFKRAHLYNLMSQGKFLKSIRLGVRAVGWNAAKVDQCITERLPAWDRMNLLGSRK